MKAHAIVDTLLEDEEVLTPIQAAFIKVQKQQRYEGPEDMFSKSSNPGVQFGTGVWTHALEHGGDLVHRLAYTGTMKDFGGGGVGYGRDAALSKAQKLLYTMKPKKGWMSAGDEVAQNITHNYRYFTENGEFSGSEEEFQKTVRDAGERYAQAYEQIQPVTEMQKLGRDIAIDFGRFRFDASVPKLKRLVDLLTSPDWETLYWTPL